MLNYEEIVDMTRSALKEKIPVGTNYLGITGYEGWEDVNPEMLPNVYRRDVEKCVKDTAAEGNNFVYTQFRLDEHYVKELSEKGFRVTTPVNGFARIEWGLR